MPSVLAASHATRIWTARLAVAATVASGALALAGALHGRADLARYTTTVVAWLGWGAMLVVVLVPSAAGLTALRLLVPAHLAAMVTCWAAGCGVERALPALVIGLIAAAVVASADTGRTFVQASAYGHEQRFPLRIPAPFIAPLVVTWVLWDASLLGGALLLAGHRVVAGAACLAAAVGAAWFLWPRWHRFSQRWLVVVPAGLVVHDPVMLGETAMVPTANIRHAALAREGTGALDISGPASGHLVEIGVGEMTTMMVRSGATSGSAVHVQSFLVAPSRPGAALAALTTPPSR